MYMYRLFRRFSAFAVICSVLFIILLLQTITGTGKNRFHSRHAAVATATHSRSPAVATATHSLSPAVASATRHPSPPVATATQRLKLAVATATLHLSLAEASATRCLNPVVTWLTRCATPARWSCPAYSPSVQTSAVTTVKRQVQCIGILPHTLYILYRVSPEASRGL
jgi:hypothetical protein